MAFSNDCKAAVDAFANELFAIYGRTHEVMDPLQELMWNLPKEPQERVAKLTPHVKNADALVATFPPYEKAIASLGVAVAPLAEQFRRDMAALRDLAGKLESAQKE